MSDALIIWDARHENHKLQDFIDQLVMELDRFALTYRVVALKNQAQRDANQVKPSMRALLDLVQRESPLHLITFGSKANTLASLISPALKCKLLTNKLPVWLDLEPASSAFTRIAHYINNEIVWGSDHFLGDYFYPYRLSEATKDICLFSNDDCSEEAERYLQCQGVPCTVIKDENTVIKADVFLSRPGLLIASSGFAQDNGLIERANAHGLPVLLISSELRNFGICDGVNGWVVKEGDALGLVNCVLNWREMSQNARDMISYYSQLTQSEQSGFRAFCSELGYPERLERKDFKLRG